MKLKTAALVVLALLSLVCPLAERIVTGRVEMFSAFDLAGTFLSGLPIYCWYHADKHLHNYRAGWLMNIGVILLAIVALPIYFFRSRGAKSGVLITLAALLVAGVCSGLGEIGVWVGGFVS